MLYYKCLKDKAFKLRQTDFFIIAPVYQTPGALLISGGFFATRLNHSHTGKAAAAQIISPLYGSGLSFSFAIRFHCLPASPATRIPVIFHALQFFTLPRSPVPPDNQTQSPQ